MERIADKGVALALCFVAAVAARDVAGSGAGGGGQTGASAALVAGGLVAVLVSALAELGREVDPRPWRHVPVVACAGAVVWPGALPWLPLLVYDVSCLGRWWLLAPAAALLACLGRVPGLVIVVVAVLGGCVGLMAWRTANVAAVIERYRTLRDELTATSQRLHAWNADLAERQDLEVRLATADERSRIAREIHDNAGHLLTRSLLQAQALMVSRPDVSERLAPLAATLADAMDTIRASVHGLRDEAVDLEASLVALGAGTRLRIALDYQAGDLPPVVGRAFAAIAREAVANTLRHSDARSVRIAVVERPGVYQLTAHDDGSRPAPDGPTRGGVPLGAGTGGMGLATIEERARALGGVAKAGFDEGFRVFVSVPRTNAKE
ncbi:MAG: histidine kinase [Bifidobacteriaceae bacterium]|nr:histidine kinase [Bifidobacteriaceae bacterium]